MNEMKGLLMKYGLIGEKLSHSFSPQIHKAFFEISGIQGEYRLFELKGHEIKGFLERAVREGYTGINVTIPYKTDVIPFLSSMSMEACQIGAVNTITIGSELKGYNTDYYGIAYTLIKHKVNIDGMNALITGSGGAARAVVAFLSDQGVQNLYMASRNPSEAALKFPGVIPISYEDISGCKPFGIIVNTTPVGMYPKPGISPLTEEQLKGCGFLFDLIYNPPKTKLMEFADRLEIPNVNGLYMLVAQAIKAQEIWNGQEYGLAMADAVYQRIAARE